MNEFIQSQDKIKLDLTEIILSSPKQVETEKDEKSTLRTEKINKSMLKTNYQNYGNLSERDTLLKTESNFENVFLKKRKQPS